MSRAIEDYICASEDRSHYNNEIYSSYAYWGLYSITPAYYPIQSYYCNPQPTPPSPPNVTIIKQVISKEEINEIIDGTIPRIAESISNRIGDIIENSDLDSGEES